MKFRDFLKLHPMFPVVVLFSFAVSGTTLYIGQRVIAVVELILGIILSVTIFVLEKNSFDRLRKTVFMLNDKIIASGDDRVSNIPLPFVVCSESGTMLWYNSLFDERIIGDEELTFKQIKNFVSADNIRDGNESGYFYASYKERRYTVYLSRTACNDGEYVLYFIDDTALKDVADKYKATRPAVMLISIDAMDAVYSMMTQNEYSALLSDCERMINVWFTKYMCVLRKLSEGRFIVISEYSIFEQMKTNKFDLLDSIREHRLEGVPTGMTISIGVGTGMDLYACETAARRSLDMAKGRGGDQAVINDNENYEFFGGVASGVESRNQVQSRMVAASVEDIIKHSASVFIMGHKSSDLDALGSSIGLAEIVSQLGTTVHIVIDEKNTMAKPLLTYCKSNDNKDLFISPETALDEFRENSLLVITDVMRPGFTDAPMLVEIAKRIVVIDHHRMSVDHISDSIIFYHEPNSSSASEMVTELIRYMPSKPKISKSASEALLSGIYLDTKNFTLKTGVRTFEAAAYLKEHGADTITVRKLFSATSEENAMVSGIVNSAEIRGKFAFAETTIKTPSVRLAAAKAADELLNIEDVDASFVIFPSGNSDSAISARSYGRVNVQVIMEYLGGGGHQTMAASQLKNKTVEQARAMLDDAVENFISRNKKTDK